MTDDGGGADRGTGTAPRLGPYDGLVKVAHALGFAVLLLAEYWRQLLDDVRPGAQPPSGLRSVLEAAASLSDDDWHRAAVDLFETVSFGQERAALWAAVFFALVVRWNKHGPAEAQLALSYVSAAYCALATAVGLYYAASGFIVLPSLGIAFCTVYYVTRD
jgi:hypothetical protein